MNATAVACSACDAPLRPADFRAPDFHPCPQCGVPLQLHVFPALLRPAESTTAVALLDAAESSCFYHAQKRAVVACDSCGRFLCALCDIEIGEEHRCPGCLEAGQRKGTLPTLERQRPLYDSIALACATLPILMWPFTLITAPLTLFIVGRYWNRPLSLTPRRRWRFLLAAVIALVQLGGWATLFYFVISSYGTRD